MLKLQNFRVAVTDETPLAALVAKRLKLPRQAVTDVMIIRRAVDARRKNNINFVFSLYIQTELPDGQVLSRLNGDKDVLAVSEQSPDAVELGHKPLTHRPVVVGAGPAGMLAALLLAEHGYRPLLVERGRDVDQRTQDVANFWKTGCFDNISNVQFGEGGAGTFSDGKLTTRVNDPRMLQVLDIFIQAGAPAEIRYAHKPHIGTDKLRQVVKNIRRRIIELGGEVRFEAQITDIRTADNRLKALRINEEPFTDCAVALVAIGHSARDSYGMLYSRGVAMEAKPFAIGVRIEHPQSHIDKAQYGVMAGHHKLGAADYALVYHHKPSGRTAYSFCMCPGGIVVAAASEPGGVVTNGMSLYQRDSGIANSALVVNVTPEDCGHDVLAGIEFQRHYEQLAFALGGHDYAAPVQTVGDFLAGTSGSTRFLTKPSYLPGVVCADLRHCLPAFVTDTLAMALPDFGRRIQGFCQPEAVMTGVETRTSAPVRMVRGQDYQSVTVPGLYPIGEGAGYAGGIMSAALDGVNAALAIMKEYRP